jgi:hypothetical protein
MTHDQAMIYTVVGVIAGLAMTGTLAKWRQDKAGPPVFAPGETADPSAALPEDDDAELHPSGWTELRPAWGVRVIVPFVALVLLFTVDTAPFWNFFAVSNQLLKNAAFVLVGALLAYNWFMVLFVQRVTYDSQKIESCGSDFVPQSRDLTSLISVRDHEKRPVLVLAFIDQKPLYVPKYIAQRGRFLADMERIVRANRMMPTQTELRTELDFDLDIAQSA